MRMHLIVAAMAGVVGAATAMAAPLIGQASIIDGDTIEIHGQRVRLWGIDAPESSQLCRNANSDLYRCGAKAANALANHVAGKPVRCESVDRDRYGRTVARCFVGGVDMAEWLVRSGLAVDWPRYSKGRYAEAQIEAQRSEQGIWAGTSVNPWDYRACVGSGGRPASCSDGER